MKERIKILYKKDRTLAVKAVNVLGYKIKSNISFKDFIDKKDKEPKRFITLDSDEIEDKLISLQKKGKRSSVYTIIYNVLHWFIKDVDWKNIKKGDLFKVKKIKVCVNSLEREIAHWLIENPKIAKDYLYVFPEKVIDKEKVNEFKDYFNS